MKNQLRRCGVTCSDSSIVGERLVGHGNTIKLVIPTQTDLKKIEAMFTQQGTVEWLNIDNPLLAASELPSLLERTENLRSRIKTLVDISQLSAMGDSDSTRFILLFAQAAKPTQLLFAIKEIRGNRLLGAIVLQVSIVHQIGQVRTIIDPEYQNKGYGRTAKCLVLQLAFEHFELEVIDSYLLSNNVRTERVNRNLGFEEPILLPNYALVAGTRRDVYHMMMQRRDWFSHRGSEYHNNHCEELHIFI